MRLLAVAKVSYITVIDLSGQKVRLIVGTVSADTWVLQTDWNCVVPLDDFG